MKLSMKSDENTDAHIERSKSALPLPHPGVLIFLWVCMLIAMQSLEAAALLAASASLLLIAYVLSAARLLTLIRRTRWIMFALLLVYAYATPGTVVWSMLGQFSPTREGMLDGLLQLGRLLAALAALAILLQLLTREQLIGGLYALAYPLKYFGWSRERVAARLALTLHYAESAMRQTGGSWHGRMSDMLAATSATHEATQVYVEIRVTSFTWRDGMLTAAGCALLLWTLL